MMMHLPDFAALRFGFDTARIAAACCPVRLLPDQRRALFIAERMRADFVYNTAALEGNPFTFPEVKTLLDGITVGGHRIADAEQVMNLNRALTYVLKRVREGSFVFNAETACAIQGIVAREEALSWGTFRDGNVSIGGTDYKPPPAPALPEIFARGQACLESVAPPLLRAFLIFLWGSLNQFFYDGNKRTSRLLAIGTLLQAGLPPLMIRAKDQLVYNQTMTRFYDTQEATPALEWLCQYYQETTADFGFANAAAETDCGKTPA